MAPRSLTILWNTFSAAPHRLFFWAGAGYAVIAVGVWTVQQASLFTSLLAPIVWSIPYPAAHGFMMIHGLFAFYFFGFLLTTFPRWLNGEPIPKVIYLPAWLLLLGGAHLFWIGLFIGKGAVITGGALVFAGHGLATVGCLRVLMAARPRVPPQQVLIAAGLLFGMVAIALFGWGVSGGDPAILVAARLVGIYPFLLLVIFSVVHRMLPFFTSTATEGYELRRPAHALPFFAAFLAARGLLEFFGLSQWTWLADGGLLAVVTWELVAWRFWRAPAIPLLLILYAGVAWIWLSFALSAAESLYLIVSGAPTRPFGNAALHALAVGGFGSLLIGISTRVTLGHSGRGLATGRLTSLLFLLFQIVPAMRVVPEVLGFWWPPLRVQGFWAGVLWVALFAVWFIVLGRILLRPRSDGRPG